MKKTPVLKMLFSVDRSVYFPGDTVHLTVQRNDSTATVVVTPILIIEGVTLKSINNNIYNAVIPPDLCSGYEYDKNNHLEALH